MLSDFRYIQQLEEECPGLDLEIRPPGTEMLDWSVQVAGRDALRRSWPSKATR